MKPSKYLFLFPHQDDETGIFHILQILLSKGKEVHCFFFVSDPFLSLTRNYESESVLLRIGVPQENIHFIGSEKHLPDGRLIDYLDYLYQWLVNWIASQNSFCALYLPAWEGGHPDHDALHAVGVAAALHHNMLHDTYQYPLYNSYQCRGTLFRVLFPLPSNGQHNKFRIPLKKRIKYLSYCLSYPSQLKAWIGLFPFFLLHFIFNGNQSLQSVSVSRLFERPHEGKLYYVKRKFCNEAYFVRKINLFLNSIGIEKINN